MAERKTKKFLISGRVQGVGFRWFTKRAADRTGVSGTVKNLADGRVEAVAQGTGNALDAFRSELKQGPPASRVDSIDEQSAKDSSYDSFEITG